MLGCCFFIAGLGVALATVVTIPQSSYEAARGDNITLPCKFTTTVAVPKPIVTWAFVTADGEEQTVVTYYADSGPDVEAAYAGRIELRVSVPTGDVALTIMKLTLQENNKIRCKVQIPKDTSGKGYASTTLVVLVAPSPPVCRIVGTTEYFENINMTCASEEGSPAPTYKWQSYTVNNVPRPNPLKATDVNGLLSLYNISIDTSGFFVCTSQNKIRSATCNVTLAVMPPSMKLGSVGAALIAAAVIGLILAAIGIYCCCCRKRKEQSEEYTMGVAEGEDYHDKEPVENGDRQIESRGKQVEQSPPEHHDRDYDDGHSDYDERRDRYDDRRDDQRDRYDDRRDRYDDRRDDQRDRYDDRRDRYDDRRDRYDDRRDDQRDRYDDRRDDRRNDRRDRYDD